MYLSITSAAVNILSLSLVVFASNVVELTPANFDAVVGQGKPALVELCVQLLLIPWSPLTWGFFKALHLGGEWSLSYLVVSCSRNGRTSQWSLQSTSQTLNYFLSCLLT